MQYTTLPTTDIRVSRACLGTMSFGAHVSEATAFEVMDQALARGVNFFDTAEMYPVPPSPATYGNTESIIGRWLRSRQTRDKVVLATKVAGPRMGRNWIREGENRLDRKNIFAAVDGSLTRLQTDLIDLYQIHWPDRNLPTFGERGFVHDPHEEMTPIAETLGVLQELQRAGKIRHIGISNESPWGTLEYLRLAKEQGLPRAVTVQNNYSLLTRTYDIAMAEVSHRENIGLLAYSPLGYGVLGGRYLNGQLPAGGRLTVYPDFAARYRLPHVEALVKKYADLAASHGLTLPQLALAFVCSRSFLTSAIIGPSTVEQLTEDVDALAITLSPEILAAIEAIHEQCPNPCA